MVELWRRGKQMIENGRVVADGARVIVVLDHYVDALPLGSLDESCNAGAGSIDELAVGISWQHAGQQQQARVITVMHEVEHLANHLRLLTSDQVDVGNGASMLESQTVQQVQLFVAHGHPDVDALIAQLAYACCRLLDADFLLFGDFRHVVEENGDSSLGMSLRSGQQHHRQQHDNSHYSLHSKYFLGFSLTSRMTGGRRAGI